VTKRQLLAGVLVLFALAAPAGAASARAGGDFPARIDLPAGFGFPEGIEHGRGTTFFVGSHWITELPLRRGGAK
jgi:hypothetical protein